MVFYKQSKMLKVNSLLLAIALHYHVNGLLKCYYYVYILFKLQLVMPNRLDR